MEKMNLKTRARIHSLAGELAEVEIVEKRGDNEYVALYNGKRFSAIFNPFAGCFYVEDIYGTITE